MIKINENILNEILKQAVNGYPEEICGLCSGKEENPHVANSIYPCENTQNRLHEENPEKYPRTAVDAYNIDPEQWMKIMCQTQSGGDVINIIYHSHIDCGAYFSEEDKRMAAPFGEPSYPDLVYFVVSVINKKVSGTAFFAWDSKEKDFVRKDG